jgi:transcription elongation factor Elf1
VKKITDGVYEKDGALHLFVEEMLDAAGYADTPANRETLTKAAIEQLRITWPHIAIKIDDRPELTRIATFQCPRCGKKMDTMGTSRGEAGTPNCGDVAACMYCGLPMVFDHAPLTGMMCLRTMTDADVEALSSDQLHELARVMRAAQAMAAQKQQ